MATASSMPKQTAPSAPAAPAPAPAAKPEKAPKVKWQTLFATAEAAVSEAQSREKGPRRAFKTTFNGTDLFIVANNEGRAGGVAFAQAGGVVEEIGRVKKAKQLGVDGIMSAMNALPEAERLAVMAQLKVLAGIKK